MGVRRLLIVVVGYSSGVLTSSSGGSHRSRSLAVLLVGFAMLSKVVTSPAKRKTQRTSQSLSIYRVQSEKSSLREVTTTAWDIATIRFLLSVSTLVSFQVFQSLELLSATFFVTRVKLVSLDGAGRSGSRRSRDSVSRVNC